LLQGLLLLCEASLSGMGRGATLLDEQKTFSGAWISCALNMAGPSACPYAGP
jgi:hypothetical protein